MFQLELLEGWIIHNVFNKDLLTRCKKPHFPGQHMEPAPLSDIINEEEKYEVEEIRKHRKCQEYSMKYIYSTSQMSKLSLTLCTFSITSSVASLFLTEDENGKLNF